LVEEVDLGERMSAETAVDAPVERIGRLMYDRSPAFADEFAPDGVLVGSEIGEVARGRDAVRSMIAIFHARPIRYTWRWERIDRRVENQQGWLFAEGAAVAEAPDGTRTERPYRLSGVLVHEEGCWRWTLFHGSEPRG
jgi:uncharacterized protein (TIGR02246 family)